MVDPLGVGRLGLPIRQELNSRLVTSCFYRLYLSHRFCSEAVSHETYVVVKKQSRKNSLFALPSFRKGGRTGNRGTEGNLPWQPFLVAGRDSSKVRTACQPEFFAPARFGLSSRGSPPQASGAKATPLPPACQPPCQKIFSRPKIAIFL